MSIRTKEKNVGGAGGYRVVDHLAERAVGSLSRVVGVKNVMRPFWNRWRESRIGEETIMRFLNRINSIDDWPDQAMELVAEAERELAGVRGAEERITALRRLSYLAHMAQWGCMAISDTKKEAYRKSRDYYVEAEQLAWGDRYQRVEIPWGDGVCHGNLHLPENPEGAPLVVIVHGMDDSKEEHLSTELVCQAAGVAVVSVDGPGQGESLFLDNMFWPTDFHRIVSNAIDTVPGKYNLDASKIGVIGISWGGTWAIKAAAADQRVGAVFDLGGPIDLSRWHKYPYFLKSKWCQVLGGQRPMDIPGWENAFAMTDRAELDKIRVPVRIVHGGKDPLVSTRDKEWLRKELLDLHPEQDVTLRLFPDGDHCCTANGTEVREDGADFFRRVLGDPLQLNNR